MALESPAGAARQSGRRAGPRAAQVEELARSVQEATGESVELAHMDRGRLAARVVEYNGQHQANAARRSVK